MLLSIRRLADIARAKFVFVHTFTLNPSSAAPAEQVGSPGFGAAPSVMSISASSIAITAKEHLSATGAQGC